MLYLSLPWVCFRGGGGGGRWGMAVGSMAHQDNFTHFEPSQSQSGLNTDRQEKPPDYPQAELVSHVTQAWLKATVVKWWAIKSAKGIILNHLAVGVALELLPQKRQEAHIVLSHWEWCWVKVSHEMSLVICLQDFRPGKT